MSTIKQVQEDPYLLYSRKVAQVESGNNPNAKNPYSSAAGLFQFTSSTFKGVSDKYKLGYDEEDRLNPAKAEKAFKLFTQENAARLTPVLGRTPNDADLYMAHFLGSGGANKFFSGYNQNPNAPVTSVVSPAVVAANRNVMIGKDGKVKTLQEVYNWAQSKMDITPQNVTQEFTDYDNRSPFNNFTPQTSEAIAVVNGQGKQTEQEEDKTIAAQKELEQKTNEFNFVQDYLKQQEQAPQMQAIQQPEQQQFPQSPDILSQYAEVSNFVDNPIMQNGGTVQKDKQWLNNWYNNRQIPNKDLQNLYLEDLPYYRQNLKTLPNPTYVNSIAPNVTGRTRFDKKDILVAKNAQPSVYLHEGDHWANAFPSAMRTVHQDIVNYNILPKDQVKGIYREKYKYFSDPDEIHSRIQVLRRRAGIKPNQKVTPEFLDKFFKGYKGDDENINDLLNLSKQGGLLEMLNYMAINDNQQEEVYYAQNGGQIPVSSRGVYDYPNQTVLVPTQGNLTMRNVNYPILATSLQTGEQQLMMPNVPNYYFKNTNSVLEIPLKK